MFYDEVNDIWRIINLPTLMFYDDIVGIRTINKFKLFNMIEAITKHAVIKIGLHAIECSAYSFDQLVYLLGVSKNTKLHKNALCEMLFTFMFNKELRYRFEG